MKGRQRSAGSPTSAGPTSTRAGGKGANLGELVAAGLPVPPGFVITTAAYREFVTANQIAADIVDRATSPDGPAAAAEHIADLFRAGTVPDHLRDQIVAAYDGAESRALRTRPSPYAPRPPRRTWPTRVSPASRRPT